MQVMIKLIAGVPMRESSVKTLAATLPPLWRPSPDRRAPGGSISPALASASTRGVRVGEGAIIVFDGLVYFLLASWSMLLL